MVDSESQEERLLSYISVKAAIFTSVPYMGPAPRGMWPVPSETFSAEIAARSMDSSLEQFELADQLGFDWVTLAEHHFAPMSLTPNPMVMAGALTQRVKHAKIALLGANIPILNPVRVAEEFAMLDALTGGRVVAGMLRGTSNEYVTYATNPAESRERFEEALELIVKAWTEPQPFGWQGRFYEYRTISIWPRPVQQPHPPIYMSGSSPESGEFAARHHISLGFAFTTVPLAAKAAAYYREQAVGCGWEPTPDDVLYRLSVHVADTDQEAIDDLLAAGAAERRAGFATSNRALDDTAASLGYYGRDVENQRGRLRPHDLNERMALGQLLAGSPDSVLSQIRALRDEVGCGILDLIFQPVGHDKTLKAIELFGRKVLPCMREL
jgi:alkanesulfonate monooxygenase SsuD/methylene tetrahydromethanopterin reductase-like flavin-dependent oxidoreductase (luciferase family)